MRMMVRCGDEECKTEFYVDSMDAVWECTNCGRQITNRNYPFLTARLMQAKIDGSSADWKLMFAELVKAARIEVGARGGRSEDFPFLEEAEAELSENSLTNSQWREKHDRLLERARDTILALENV
ncbi:MAG: hypothetical protein ACMUHU_06190 [Thermoplasmatota archaeon]